MSKSPEELYEKYSHLAKITLHKMYANPTGIAAQHRLEYDDLLQYANLGLWRSCLDYDPTKSKFTTHAIKYIRWGIANKLKRECQIIRYPVNKDYPHDKMFGVVSTEQKVGSGEEGHVFHDVIASQDNLDILTLTENRIDMRRLLKSIIPMANEREKVIIEGKLQGLSSEKIGFKLDLTGSRVRVLWNNFKKKLESEGKVVFD